MKHGVATLTFFVLIVMMTNAQQPTLVLEGYATDDHYGEVVRKAGDVDGDGTCDFVVTASQRIVPNTLAGVGGCAGNGFAEIRSGVNGSLIHYLSHPTTTMFGRSADAGKDYDGDGVPDVLIGASSPTPYISQCTFAGRQRATVFSGATGLSLSSWDDLILFGTVANHNWAGFAVDVALLDDISGDGLADALVSWTPSIHGGCGGGFAILDRFGSFVTTYQCPGPPLYFPSSIGPIVDDVGDIDGNGLTDILVINPTNGFVVVDGLGSLTTSFSTQMVPNAPLTGIASGAVGDVNGDGINDYLTSGPTTPAIVTQGLGEVFVFSGADDTILWDASSDEPGADFMGTDVATQGDFDGDGIDDYAAGAPQPRYLTDRSGYVRVWSGATGAVLATIPSPSTNAEFGNSVDFLDDIDGDGRDDLVIGAWRADTSLGTQAGAAYVYTAADVLDVNNSSACAAGNVDVTGGGPFDVLTVNGSAGSTIQRQVGVGLDEPITFGVDAPPGGPTAPIFVLFGRFGLAPLSELFATPFGDFCHLPSLFAPPFSGRFILASSTGSAGLSLFPPAGPAPWNRTVFAGVPFPVQITLQALIQSTTAPNGFAISNAVVTSIY